MERPLLYCPSYPHLPCHRCFPAVPSEEDGQRYISSHPHQHREGEAGYPWRGRRGRYSTAGVAGVCPTPGLLHRLFSAEQAWQALRWFWRTSPPAAGNAAFQERFLACMHRSSTQRPLTAKPPGHQPWGTQSKGRASAKPCVTPAFMPSEGFLRSHA